MRKIALNYIYLSRKHAGGKDQVGINLLKGFQENGYAKEMHLICYAYSVDMLKKISPDIHIISIPSPLFRGEANRIIFNSIVNTLIIPRIISKYNIDLIFHLDCNNGLRNFKSVIAVVIPHDIKTIAHRELPGLHIPFYKYWLYKFIYYSDFAHASKIIAISDVDKSEIQEFFPQFRDKVVRIYNPIDIPIDVDCIQNRKQNIVAINLQFHHKNIITLIKAFELIKDQIAENLILVGNVPPRVAYLKEYVEEHNLEDRVIFTGFISDKEKNNLLRNCCLYVSPTLFEGFGMVSVEAMILGAPTLVSKISANYEVTKGLCDYYEPAEDEHILSEALLKAIRERKDIIDLQHNSEIIWKEYNYLSISRLYWNVMNEEY